VNEAVSLDDGDQPSLAGVNRYRQTDPIEIDVRNAAGILFEVESNACSMRQAKNEIRETHCTQCDGAPT